LTFSEDSRIWTFSVTVSVALVLLVAGLIERHLARRRRGTSSRKDTS
jgi:hypothetical protein